MEEFSNTSVWELLKIMQHKVKENAEVIQKNVKSVEQLKEKYDPSKKRDKVVETIYKQNLELTQENSNLLELHNYLYKFYKNYKHLLVKSFEVDKKISKTEYRELCMSKYISGELKLTSKHPFMDDNTFLHELMERCMSLELYERCSEIKQLELLSSKNF